MKKNINQQVADELDRMELSESARDLIAATDINVMAEVFGAMTAQEIEEMAKEQEETK